MAQVDYRSLPFDEAIKFFQAKVNVPTQRWDDLWMGMHAPAFSVAGATRAELLADLRGAIDKAISQGTTLATFRKDFDTIVQRHGWSYKGGRGWRTSVMLRTNLKTAYAAGRYQQLKEARKRRPYWKYHHGDSRNPRPLHLGWDGKIIAADDPWWDTHFPPNGWGCSCKVFSVSRGELERMGKAGPDKAPDDGAYQWTDKAGRVHTIPNGIDPGWDYNVGQAADNGTWGRGAAKAVMDRGPWTEANPWTPARYPWLPDKLAPVPAPVPLGPVQKTEAGLRAALPEGVYTDPLGAPVQVTQAIVDHILDDPPKRWNGRERYFPLIPHVLQNPAEVWFGFIRYENGSYAIRRRYVAAYQAEGKRVVGVLVDTQGGNLVAMDAMHGSTLSAGRLRFGRLAYPMKGDGEG